MTVTYTSEVATITGFGVFWKLLWRWKGSIYKLIWKELLVYICFYYMIRETYIYAFTAEHQLYFKGLVLYCRSYSTNIPLSFVLGFYVNLVMTRWWAQYESLPWPDPLAVYVSNLVQGMDERGRLMRRTILRYINLSYVITLAMISPRVKKRFPTLKHLVEAGILTVGEMNIFENLNKKFTHSLYWMPLVWAGSIVNRGRQEGRIKDDFSVKTLLDTINNYRSGLGGLLNYDMISIPLVYTQVVTLAVYTFFASTLISSQFLISDGGSENKDSEDFFVPWFTILQYLFYVGWLKVAESLVNPFGEDDDDFELNWLIDRNLQVSYLIVDEMHNEHPELIQDKYWDEIFPSDLPYTVATEAYRRGPILGSTCNMDMRRHEQLFVRYDDEFENESDVGISTPGTRRKYGVDDTEAPPQSPTSLKLSAITEEHTNKNRPVYEDLWTTSNTRNHSSGLLSHLRFRRQTSSSLKSPASSASLKYMSQKSIWNQPGKSPDVEENLLPTENIKNENDKRVHSNLEEVNTDESKGTESTELLNHEK